MNPEQQQAINDLRHSINESKVEIKQLKFYLVDKIKGYNQKLYDSIDKDPFSILKHRIVIDIFLKEWTNVVNSYEDTIFEAIKTLEQNR